MCGYSAMSLRSRTARVLAGALRCAPYEGTQSDDDEDEADDAGNKEGDGDGEKSDDADDKGDDEIPSTREL